MAKLKNGSIVYSSDRLTEYAIWHAGNFNPANKSDTTHDHSGVYSPVGHDHSGVYSPVGHDHSGVYAPASHSHNDLYYTETEINALFNTTSGHDHNGTNSKKIAWTDIDSKPSTYTPSSHDNTAHSATYITASGVTYTNLNNNGSVGTGSNQVAVGNHGHALTGLSDVNVSNPSDGQVLAWDTGTSKWVAETPAGSVDQGEVVKLAWFWN